MPNCYGSISSTYRESKVSCVSPQEFDSMVDYNSKQPFKNLQGPPVGSKISIYWKRGDVTAPGNIILTLTEYVKYQSIKVGSQMTTKSMNIPSGNSYTGKGNGLNNPVNLSCGSISKLYGGNESHTMSDGQKNAKFPNMESGVAAAMHFYIETYHGKNVCQVNNQHQGYFSQDCKDIKDGIGMAALRLRWVSHNCSKLNLKPNEQLNLKDKETLFAFISSTSYSENGITLQRGLLEKAYAMVKNK